MTCFDVMNLEMVQLLRALSLPPLAGGLVLDFHFTTLAWIGFHWSWLCWPSSSAFGLCCRPMPLPWEAPVALNSNLAGQRHWKKK